MSTHTTVPRPLDDPAPVLATYLRDRPVHPYGIADAAQLWHCSRWWRAGDAVVALLDLPGSDVPVVYAVSAGAAQETLDLLAALEPALPARLVATAPRGMARRLRPSYRAAWVRDYVKMHLADPALLPAPDPRAATLGRDDLDALERLYATDEAAGDFFYAGLLDSGLYLGSWDGDRLVACAGIHVLDEEHGVAAIGNVATHPAYRRRGLARALVATLCHRLLARVDVVGLNVAEPNRAAHDLYASIGFRTVVPYEECELVRRRGAS